MGQTLAEIEKEFDAKLRAAPEDQRPTIEMELERAKAKFWQDQSEQQQIDGWRKDAVIAYPLARMKEVTARTQEGIMAEAKASHEDVEQIRASAAAEQKKKDDDEAIRNGWGPSGVGGGGGGGNRSTPGSKTDDEQFAEDVNAGHDGLRRGTLTPLQGERLERARIGVIAEHFTDPNAAERARRRR